MRFREDSSGKVYQIFRNTYDQHTVDVTHKLMCITQCQGPVIFRVCAVPPGKKLQLACIMWVSNAVHVHRQHVSLISTTTGLAVFVKAIEEAVFLFWRAFSRLEDNLITDALSWHVPSCLVWWVWFPQLQIKSPMFQSCQWLLYWWMTDWFLLCWPQNQPITWILIWYDLWLHNGIT